MIRILQVTFDTQIKPWEVPAFRGALATKVGWEHDAFHNHQSGSEGKKFHYRLPLIQYKQDGGMPLLLCIEEGISEIERYFLQPSWSLEMHGKIHPMRIKRMEVEMFSFTVEERMYRYHIKQWIALSDENYPLYGRLETLPERLQFLQQILCAQLFALQLQLGTATTDRIRVALQDLQSAHWITYKGVKMRAFNLIFDCNVLLPNHIGFGKGASTGWGVVTLARDTRNNKANTKKR
jgi:hypothetical protein